MTMHNNELGFEIASLAEYALRNGLIENEDLTWAKNRIANLIAEPACPPKARRYRGRFGYRRLSRTQRCFQIGAVL